MLITAAAEVPQGNDEPAPDPRQAQNKKLMTQGCLIGGLVFLLGGLGFGSAGWMFDHSNHSTNQDVDIDLSINSDCFHTKMPDSLLNP